MQYQYYLRTLLNSQEQKKKIFTIKLCYLCSKANLEKAAESFHHLILGNEMLKLSDWEVMYVVSFIVFLNFETSQPPEKPNITLNK